MEIRFNNVTYKENIKTPLEKVYLKDINLVIKGEVVTTILGDSKSGKSYIGELINAVISPTFGNIKLLNFVNDGKRIKNVNLLRMNVGYVSMNPSNMLFNKTVKNELEFGIKYFKYKSDKKSVRCTEALKLVNLSEEYLNKNISELTLNEKKKVCLASVLVFNPRIIILDEPTIGLNYRDKEDLKRLILLLKQRYKRTIILLTKDTDFAYSLTDECFVLNNGVLKCHGTKLIMQDEKIMNSNNLKVPEILMFINESKKRNIELKPTGNILDLIKEVYRNAK